MRTTLTLDDDVVSRLRPLLARGKSKKVINDLLRKALDIRPAAEVELAVFQLGLRQGIDPTAFNKLAEHEALIDDARRFGS